MNKVIIDLLNSGYPCDLNDPASQRDISDYENRKGVKLPDHLKDWLRFSNGCEIMVPGTRFYSVNKDDKYSIALKNASTFRDKLRLPAYLLIIGKTNFGDILCVDLRNSELVQWNHENYSEYLRWPSVFDYIAEEIHSYAETV